MTDRDDELPKFTHKVTMTLMSNEDDTDVGVEIKWDPQMTGADYKALGYQPACHRFIEVYVLPMLEEAFMAHEFPELMQDPPSTARN